MKANEAPERLYLHPTAKGNVGASWLRFQLTNEDIEYIRKDAFIEKARKWFEEHFGNRLKWEITTYEFEDMQSMIENFKKYMKGERV